MLVTGGRALGGGQWVVAVVWWCQRVGVALGGGGGSDSLVLGGACGGMLVPSREWVVQAHWN